MSDDSISRKAVIDFLYDFFDGMLETDSFDPVDIYHGIEDLPSAELEPHWIPCSERYPEENQICIVTDETMRNTYEYRFCKETYDENQGWTYLKHHIIAWMPLPKPYQENAQLPTEDTTSHVQIFADGMPLEEYLAREWAKQRAYLEEHGIIFRDGGAE